MNDLTSTTATAQDTRAADDGPDGRRSTGQLLRRIAAEHLIWPILGMLFVFGSFVPGFLTGENLLNVVWGATPLGCMTIGLYFVMMAGRLDLSLESTFALAPTVAVLALTEWAPGLNPVIAILITLVVGAAVGLVNGFFSDTVGVNPLLTTLATLLAIRGLVVWLIPEGVYGIPSGYTALGGEKLLGVPIAILVFGVWFLLAWGLMKYTSFGRSLTAIGNNEDACKVAGINVSAVVISTFVLAGVSAALGGLLQAGRLFSVDASMGEGDILIVFAAVVLGGTVLTGGSGRVTGLLGAILVIAGINNLMNLIGVPSSIQGLVFGVVLLFAIVLSSFQERFRNALTT